MKSHAFCCHSKTVVVKATNAGFLHVILRSCLQFSSLNGRNVFFARFVVSPQEMSNKEIDLTYKLKVLQQELEQEESSHKASRALLADKSKIKVTIEGAKSESMKGKDQRPSVDCSRLFVPLCCEAVTRHSSLVILHL